MDPNNSPSLTHPHPANHNTYTFLTKFYSGKKFKHPPTCDHCQNSAMGIFHYTTQLSNFPPIYWGANPPITTTEKFSTLLCPSHFTSELSLYPTLTLIHPFS